MSGRDAIFIGVGLLVAIVLSSLNDFTSKVDTYSKAEEAITKIGNTYNSMREQVEINKGMSNQALGMAREAIDKYSRLQNQVDSTNRQIAELRTMYNDLKTSYRNPGQSTYSYPNTNY